MRFKTNLKYTQTLIDLTPLVDVIFLMLIFFMITSDILPLKSLSIENPKLARNSVPLTTQLLIVMDGQNVIYLGSKKEIVDLGNLKLHLEKEIASFRETFKTTPTVVLNVDRRVEYGTFLQLFSAVQECCNNVRLVYKPLDEDL